MITFRFARTVVSLTVLAFSLPLTALAGTIVYSNTTTDTGDTLSYAANGFTQIGDQITLSGTDRLATSATVQFYSDGSAGTFDATLRFFDVGSPVGVQIGSDFTMTGISAPSNNVFDVAFTLPDLLVPDNLIFTLQVSNFSSGVDINGLDMFEPPTIGLSDNTFAIANDGSGFLQTPTSAENVFFELDATQPATVPEPGPAGLTGSALLAILLLRRRAPRSIANR
jgi:hypothetical protein